MATAQKQTFSKTISINPYKNDYFSGSTTRVEVEKKPEFTKEQYAISYLNTKSFISDYISVSKNIPDEDIHYAIENKTYEELALDMATEYRINYIEAANNADENNRYFHVFVVDPISLEEEFTQSVSEVKYIDQIIPVPLLLKTLYAKEIIEDSGVHCYIYFQENDAFFTIYNEQEFVYTKSLKFSLLQMHERFCELLGEQVDKENFLTLLATEGLGTSNTDYQKYLIKLFGEIFLHINDVLTYAKRAYNIEKIDEIYIGSQIGEISGLDEYCQTYLGLSAKPFKFDYGFETEEFYIDQIHLLMHLYTLIESENKYECNFTDYHRPPPFLQRQSGKLIVTTAVALMVSMAPPIWNWSGAYALDLQTSLLQEEYSELHNIKVTREATINLKVANKTRIQKLLDVEKKEFDTKKETLTKIHDVKVNYPMKAKIISEFVADFNKQKVLLTQSSYSEEKAKVFTFNISAYRNKRITNTLKYLTKNKNDRYEFLLNSIDYDAETKRYSAELKAVLR